MCFAKQVSSKPFEIPEIPDISSWQLRFQLNASESCFTEKPVLLHWKIRVIFLCISSPLSPHFFFHISSSSRLSSKLN